MRNENDLFPIEKLYSLEYLNKDIYGIKGY